MRQLAFGDAVSPIGEVPERHAAEDAGQLVCHLLARLARLHAPDPGLFRAVEFAQAFRDRPRGRLSELMAPDAADVLDLLEPVDLRQLFGDATLAPELVRAGEPQH